MQIRPKHRPQWTEEELDVIFSKATLVLGELRKDASGIYIVMLMVRLNILWVGK
jgi:hypothetical protein